MRTLLMRLRWLTMIALGACTHGASEKATAPAATPVAGDTSTEKVMKTDEEWKQLLTPEQFRILREKGTERAFTGPYWDDHEPGVYRCAACGAILFDSRQKFESGTGWPSFYDMAKAGAVETHTDESYGMSRTEVTCARCGGHLGHVFDDGPQPTGLRYCINGGALKKDPPR